MKIVTWNVNGIRARQAQLQDLLTTEQPDVVCLQEIKASPEQVPELMVSPGEYWTYWHGGGGYSGVALLIRRTFVTEVPQFTHPGFDFENRIVEARVRVAECANLNELRLVSVYVPNGGKDFEAKMRFFDSLRAWLAETTTPGTALVLCGDLNIALEERDVHPKERKPNQIGTRPEERALLAGVLANGLTDVGRALDPENDQLFTWWAPWRSLRQRNIGWRIDYILASPALAAAAHTCQSMREFGTSDHAPVIGTFAL
jgi:exodeoxyribonuclease-3